MPTVAALQLPGDLSLLKTVIIGSSVAAALATEYKNSKSGLYENRYDALGSGLLSGIGTGVAITAQAASQHANILMTPNIVVGGAISGISAIVGHTTGMIGGVCGRAVGAIAEKVSK